MNEQVFAQIIDLITQQTGIIPRDSHKTGIQNYIDKELSTNAGKKSGPHSYEEFYKILENNHDELINLINSATVNETYFFREEAQFHLLQSKLFPQLLQQIPVKRLRIWSAACSTGEEIYSLLLLAHSMGIQTECIASDINTKVLTACNDGKYKKKAIRSVDGAAYHYLLEPYKLPGGGYEIPVDLRSKVSCRKINLSTLQGFPRNQHVIFLRNVFIYFSSEMKKQILQTIADLSLAPGGYLFVSMNEVASLDSSMIPSELEKMSDGKIFYFHKKEGSIYNWTDGKAVK